MAVTFKNYSISNDIKRIFVIIPAAGLGTRMETDTNKQLIEIAGVPVIERTLEAFSKFYEMLSKKNIVLKAVVVTNKDLVYKINSVVRYKKYTFVQNVVEGGDTRTESVWKGIEALSDLPFPPTDNDIVFIHDGARCLVDQDTLLRCLEGASKYDICAAAVPSKNTIKQIKTEDTAPVVKEEPKKEEADTDGLGKFEFRSSIFKNIFNKDDKGDDNSSENVPPIARRGNSLVNRHLEDEAPASSPFKPFIPRKAEAEAPAKKGRPASEPEVASTPKRDELMEVQTPQVFRYNKLVNSYVNGIKKNIEATDDLSLAEAMHYKAHLVEGSYSNIKITTPEDIAFAEALIKKQAEEEAAAAAEAESQN